MQFNSVNEELFGLLPDEMVIYTLNFVDPDTLLNCRLVCKSWREFIDSDVFQDKASRENEIHRFYSFSHIHPSTVKKLDLPWFVFYVICKYDPFNRNIVKNNCGQNTFVHWNLQSDNSWAIEQTPQGAPPLPDDPDFEKHKSCFVSTFRLCSKRQKVILHDYGLNSNVMKLLQPDILVSDWYSGRFDCGCKYALRAAVHNSDGKLLEQHNYDNILLQWSNPEWIKVSHVFKKQGNTSFVVVEHSGKDTQFWAGYYGSKVAGTVVKVLLPIKLKCDKILE